MMLSQSAARKRWRQAHCLIFTQQMFSPSDMGDGTDSKKFISTRRLALESDEICINAMRVMSVRKKQESRTVPNAAQRWTVTMADEMKKRTNRDYTAWDLNVPHLVFIKQRQKLEALFKRKARRKMKQELKEKE